MKPHLLLLVSFTAALVGSTLSAEAQAPAATPSQPPITASAKPTTKADLKRLLENSVWRANQGTSANPSASLTGTFTFLKDGSFTFTPSQKAWGGWDHCHFYEVATPDILKIYINNPAKNRKAPYFAFRVDFNTKTAVTDLTLGGTATAAAFIAYDKPAR